MANFLDKLLTFMGVEDEEDEDRDFDFPDRVADSPARIGRPRPEAKVTKGRLISFPTKSEGADGLTKIVLCELCDFEQVPEVVANLRSYYPVVINLRRTVSATAAQRILDFLCGVIFAIDGKIAKVEEAIYLLTPKGVSISADLDLLSLDPELDWLNR